MGLQDALVGLKQAQSEVWPSSWPLQSTGSETLGKRKHADAAALDVTQASSSTRNVYCKTRTILHAAMAGTLHPSSLFSIATEFLVACTQVRRCFAKSSMVYRRQGAMICFDFARLTDAPCVLLSWTLNKACPLTKPALANACNADSVYAAHKRGYAALVASRSKKPHICHLVTHCCSLHYSVVYCLRPTVCPTFLQICRLCSR